MYLSQAKSYMRANSSMAENLFSGSMVVDKLPKQEEDVYGADYVCTQIMDDFNDSQTTIDNVTTAGKVCAKERNLKGSGHHRAEQKSDKMSTKNRKTITKLDDNDKEAVIPWESSDEDEQLPKYMTKGVGKKSKGNVAFKSQNSEIPRNERSSFESVTDVFSKCFPYSGNLRHYHLGLK